MVLTSKKENLRHKRFPLAALLNFSFHNLSIFLSYVIRFFLFRIEYDPAICSIVDVPVHPTLPSVYGQNHDHEASFYTTLTNTIISMGNNNVILGGDWNATWDNSRVGKNLDVINMADIPSYIRSNSILKMADTLNLTDPYRIFYPNKRDFTFTPSAMQQRNR